MSGFGMPLAPSHTEESGGLAIGLKVQREHLSTLGKKLQCLSYRALRPGPLRASATEVTGDWKPSSSQDQSAFTIMYLIQLRPEEGVAGAELTMIFSGQCGAWGS